MEAALGLLGELKDQIWIPIGDRIHLQVERTKARTHIHLYVDIEREVYFLFAPWVCVAATMLLVCIQGIDCAAARCAPCMQMNGQNPNSIIRAAPPAFIICSFNGQIKPSSKRQFTRGNWAKFTARALTRRVFCLFSMLYWLRRGTVEWDFLIKQKWRNSLSAGIKYGSREFHLSGKIDLLIRAGGVYVFNKSESDLADQKWSGLCDICAVRPPKWHSTRVQAGYTYILTYIFMCAVWKKNKVRERSTISTPPPPQHAPKSALEAAPESILSILHALAKCFEIRKRKYLNDRGRGHKAGLKFILTRLHVFRFGTLSIHLGSKLFSYSINYININL